MFVAEADDSILKEKGLTIYDKQVRNVYFGMGELPEELKPFESIIGDCNHIKITIPRVKNKEGNIIRLLPTFVIPYKRYSVEDVENELDPKVIAQTIASEVTRYKWKLWWKELKEKAVILIESLAYKQKRWLSALILTIYGTFPLTLECLP